MSRHQTLLNIAVEHNYNSSGVCSSLNFNPTEKTGALFAKAGLMSRQTSSGIRIVYDEARIEALETETARMVERGFPIILSIRHTGQSTPGAVYFDTRSKFSNVIVELIQAR